MNEIPAWAIRCPTGKMKFPSTDDARSQTRGNNRKHKIPGKVKAYRCPECGSYHVTSAAKTIRKKKFK